MRTGVPGARDPIRRAQRRRELTGTLAVLSATLLLVATGLSAVLGASTTQSWTAPLGSAGAYGSVTISRLEDGTRVTYRMSATLRHFRANTTYSVTDRRGNCSVPGTQITTPLMSIRTGSTGTASRSMALYDTKGSAILKALQAGTVAIRVGTRCGYLKGPAVVITPSPVPTPITDFPIGPGVPVLAPGHGSMIVAAAETWSDPLVPVDPGTTLDTVRVQCSYGSTVCTPDFFALRDSAEVDHAAIAPGRQDDGGWLTFAVPTDLSTDVTLVWTVAGISHLVPLHLPVPPAPVMELTVATTNGLDGAAIEDAVGTPDGYVAVGFTGEGYSDWRPAAWTSPDGQTWTHHPMPQVGGGTALSVARGPTGRLVAVGTAPVSKGAYERAAIWSSADDGVTWTRVAGLPTDTIAGGIWNSVTAFGTKFVVVGNLPEHYGASGYNGHAGAMVSSDGIHWTRSSPVVGATSKKMLGVIAGGPGLVAWGGTDAYSDVVSGEAEVWTSTTGATWSIDTPARDWQNPDGGGATYREMDLVFGSSGAWTGIVTYGDYEMRPLIYGSPDAITWKPVDVAASLREFHPSAAVRVGTEWLIGGAGRPSAWLGHGGTWAPVTVPEPEGPPSYSHTAEIAAFASGPAGSLAIGTASQSYVSDPPTRQGVVWTVPTP